MGYDSLNRTHIRNQLQDLCEALKLSPAVLFKSVFNNHRLPDDIMDEIRALVERGDIGLACSSLILEYLDKHEKTVSGRIELYDRTKSLFHTLDRNDVQTLKDIRAICSISFADFIRSLDYKLIKKALSLTQRQAERLYLSLDKERDYDEEAIDPHLLFAPMQSVLPAPTGFLEQVVDFPKKTLSMPESVLDYFDNNVPDPDDNTEIMSNTIKLTVNRRHIEIFTNFNTALSQQIDLLRQVNLQSDQSTQMKRQTIEMLQELQHDASGAINDISTADQSQDQSETAKQCATTIFAKICNFGSKVVEGFAVDLGKQLLTLSLVGCLGVFGISTISNASGDLTELQEKYEQCQQQINASPNPAVILLKDFDRDTLNVTGQERI